MQPTLEQRREPVREPIDPASDPDQPLDGEEERTRLKELALQPATRRTYVRRMVLFFIWLVAEATKAANARLKLFSDDFKRDVVDGGEEDECAKRIYVYFDKEFGSASNIYPFGVDFNISVFERYLGTLKLKKNGRPLGAGAKLLVRSGFTYLHTYCGRAVPLDWNRSLQIMMTGIKKRRNSSKGSRCSRR